MQRYLTALFFAAGLLASRGYAQSAPTSAAPAELPDHPISAEERAAVVDAALDAVAKGYVFPEAAEKMAAAVRASQQQGNYDKLDSAKDFSARLTTDLQSINGDKHLRVRINAGKSAVGRLLSAGNGAEDNFGFARTEILPGNIGYLEIHLFYPLIMAKETVVKAMNQVASTRALIVDLRKHSGGSPDTIAYMTSYLFGPERIHLNDLYFRTFGTLTESWTHVEVSGMRFGPDKPVYLLTSGKTFSAGEEFAYNLQSLKRAALFGETTGGGANPGGQQTLPAGLSIFVPNGRAINPITKTNWEGVGVIPEHPMPAAKAYDAAYRELLERIDLSKETPASRAEIEAALKKLSAPE